jgi:hypothetical protein
VFHLRHNPQALNWIKQDKGGTAITFQIIPPEKGTTLGGRIIIFDAIGNVVVADPIANYKWMNLIKDGAVLSNEKKDNILPSTWNSDGMVYNYTIYWNGYTGNGTKAAPGVYKVVLKMFTKINGKTNVTQHNGFIGISK